MAAKEITVRTACPMDCPDTCSLDVEVSEGRVRSIGASREGGNPTTAGFICSKVANFGRRVEHETRLLHPLRRTGAKGAGEFERISWHEAIGEIAERFREIVARHGGEAILPYHYGGSNGFLTDGFVDDYFFARLGASRLARTLCAAPTGAVARGMYGKMPGVAFEDFPAARFVLLWGANPKASNIHLAPYLKEARRAGTKIAVVDPLRNFTDAEVDLHLPIYPGTDLPVALAMIGRWNEEERLDEEFLGRHADGMEPLLAAAKDWPLERAAAVARVSAEAIQELGEMYAGASPALLRIGWGLERNRNGGQAVAALMAMPALMGKFGTRGGGYTLSNGGGAKFDAAKLLDAMPWTTREINMTQLGAILEGSLDHELHPPVKALYIYNCNPAATAPDQESVLRGLAREEIFTVVHEQVMTDTAVYADIVLPATTFLEHYDVRRGYGTYVIAGVRPAIAARGEARDNTEVFAALGRAMGWNDVAFQRTTREWVEEISRGIEMRGAPPDAAALAEGGMHYYDFPGAAPVQFETVFPLTPDGKIHLTPEALGDAPYRYKDAKSREFSPGGHPSDEYPLALISPATSKMISSTMGEYNYPELRLTINPQDAAARGIADGATVRIFNELGEVVCRALVSDRIREGVVALPKGAWRKSSLNGKTATALCPATIDNVAGGACYNDARVEVSPLRVAAFAAD
jgi:anaerobic selenocysteine-containing dehydrogenase